MKAHASRIQAVLLLVGIAVFVWTIRSSGWDEVRTVFPAIATLAGVLVLSFYPLTSVWDVLAWRQVFPVALRPRIRFRQLFVIRLAGEAVNSITPFVDVGGEFLKGAIVSKRFAIGKRAAAAAVIVDRTVLFLAEILFWVAGLALIYVFFPVPPVWRLILGTVVLIATGLLFSVILLQTKGIFLTFIRWLEHLRIPTGWFDKFRHRLVEVDAEITAFYSLGDGRFFATVFLHFMGWVFGGVETCLMLNILGIQASLLDGIMLEAFLQIIRTASFFIPGSLGAQEAGLALAARWMGLHSSAGVALSLLKRLRQAVWMSIGFCILGILWKDEWKETMRAPA